MLPVTVNARINGERRAVLGWGRAILLQLAHPLVAAGVAEHSTFRSSPAARVLRLHATIKAMLALTFGTPAEQQAAIDRINGIHDRVHGVLTETAGRFSAGTPYTACDPALLIWVDATLRDSMPLAYERFVGPLTAAEREAYIVEGEEITARLRIPSGSRPQSGAALAEYMSTMRTNGTLAVTSAARELSREVVAPPYAGLAWPASRVNRLATIGLLPADIREAYGFAWTPDDQRALDRWSARIRAMRRVTPDRLALWPEARRSQADR
jgi:uncharacterized protein (DUF2236 family)